MNTAHTDIQTKQNPPNEVVLEVGEKKEIKNNTQCILLVSFSFIIIPFFFLILLIYFSTNSLNHIFLILFSLSLAIWGTQFCLVIRTICPITNAAIATRRVFLKNFNVFFEKSFSYIVEIELKTDNTNENLIKFPSNKDNGILFLENDKLIFIGDFLNLSIPYRCIIKKDYITIGRIQKSCIGINVKFNYTDTEHEIKIYHQLLGVVPTDILKKVCNDDSENIKSTIDLAVSKANSKTTKQMIIDLDQAIDNWLVRESGVELDLPQKPEERYPFQA
jgi:hypothetical protein